MAVDVLDLMDLPAPPPMNRDLQDWADGRADQEAVADPPQGERGPCRACGRPAEATCLRCGDPTCIRHHRIMYGLCLRCSPDDEEDEPQGRPDLDIPWIG